MDKLIQDICDVVENKYDLHALTDAQKQDIGRLIDLHVEDVIYDLSRTKVGNKFPYGDLVRFYRLPKEYKYLHTKKWEDMTFEEQGISYKSIPAARLDPMG